MYRTDNIAGHFPVSQLHCRLDCSSQVWTPETQGSIRKLNNNNEVRIIVQLGPRSKQNPILKVWTKDEH